MSQILKYNESTPNPTPPFTAANPPQPEDSWLLHEDVGRRGLACLRVAEENIDGPFDQDASLRIDAALIEYERWAETWGAA